MNFTIIILLLTVACMSCEHVNNIKSAVHKKVVAENNMQSYSAKKKKETKKNGLVISRRKNGSVLSEINLKDGKMHGWAKDYYPDGSLHATYMYDEGLLHGERKWYHENGQVYKVTPYLYGAIDGIEKIYHKSGKPKAEIPYSAGHPGTGMKEFTQEGNVNKKYPSLVIEAMDEIPRNNKYTIKIFLSDKSKKVHYYLGNLTDNKYTNDELVRVVTDKGVGTITYMVMPGYFFKEKLNIVAMHTTPQGNPYIIQKKFDVAIENKKLQ